MHLTNRLERNSLQYLSASSAPYPISTHQQKSLLDFNMDPSTPSSCAFLRFFGLSIIDKNYAHDLDWVCLSERRPKRPFTNYINQQALIRKVFQQNDSLFSTMVSPRSK